MTDIDIEINGRPLKAKSDQTIIQVADAAGIYIPRFCYHKNLSVAANCRMCLVEVEKSPKTLPACATPVMPGMKVFTQSQKTIEAQRAVMEFLLINHPLDCPICDQGGECELQDLAMGYGSSHSHYDECKRAIADQDLGPLISSDMTRCIYCTRCVRFGDEVAGLREMGGTERGEHTEIGTYVQQALTSEVSGNIIDLCPVGALTSKPYRFTARAFELDQKPSISPHDCLGTNIFVHSRYGEIKRVVARENKAINEMWLADRDRFSYTGLIHAERLEEPIARIDGVWQPVEWQTAFEMIANQFYDAITQFGADKCGALASPNSTLEEFYLLQKIIRGINSPHIDYRLRETDTRDQAFMPTFPGWGGMTMEALAECDAILLIGSNIQREQPLAALRVRKSVLNGGVVAAIHSVDETFHFPVKAKKMIAPQHLPAYLTELVKNLRENNIDEVSAVLRDKKKVCVVLGALALHHEQAAMIRALAQEIATLTGASVCLMTDGANAAGAWLAGAIPHRQAGGAAINYLGLNASEMLHKPRKIYLLMNVEPALDCANAAVAAQALQQAHFVAALSTYRDPLLEKYAHVILPLAAFTETAGTFVNGSGEWQSFNGVAAPFHASRPGWKILRVLGQFMHLSGFEYESAEEVREEVRKLYETQTITSVMSSSAATTFLNDNKIIDNRSGLSRIGEIPLYATDNIVRRAQPLQTIQPVIIGDVACVRMHPDTAKKYQLRDNTMVNVKQGTHQLRLPLHCDARIAEEAAWIAGGIAATDALGDLFGAVEITAANASASDGGATHVR